MHIFTRVKGQFFDSNGVQIHFTDEGSGEPVILLHGFVMNADLNWRDCGIIGALAREYRVIAMDFRGHGLSGKPYDTRAYGMNLVEDVRHLMDHLGIARCHLIGFSTGGFVTLKFLTLYPERLWSAAATGMSYMEMNDENRAALERIGAALEQRGDFRPLLEKLDLPTRGLYPRIRMWVMGRINDTTALSHVIRSFVEFEVDPEALRRNTVPTLSLAGTKDPIAAGVDDMHELMANHKHVWLEGGDKLSCLKMPGFRDALLEHLRAARNNEGGRA